MRDPVSLDQAGQFGDYVVRGVGIEAALVNHHICAVVAGIRTSNAGGIGELALAATQLIGIEVDKVVRGLREGIDRLHAALEVLDQAAILLP